MVCYPFRILLSGLGELVPNKNLYSDDQIVYLCELQVVIFTLNYHIQITTRFWLLDPGYC